MRQTYRKGGEPRMEAENVARFQYVQFSVLCLSAGVRYQFEWKLPTRCSEPGRMREAARRAYQLALSELGAAPVRHSYVRKLSSADSLKPSGIAWFL